jgi:flagellar export protein FliJ
MKKFRFTLQTVHDLREARRDEAERALFRAASAARAASEQLEETKQTHLRATETYAAKLQEGEIDPFDALLSINYLASLNRRERETHAQLEELEKAREAQRALTAAAAREAEATSRLRQRQRERHHLELARYEQEMLDEMATLAQARQHPEEKA